MRHSKDPIKTGSCRAKLVACDEYLAILNEGAEAKK